MLYSDNIPERLKEYPEVTRFISVLDALHEYKQEIIGSSLRVNNFAVLTDKKWILKKLGDFGITNIPYDFPLSILQQLLLNVDTFCRTRGSKIGLQFYLSVLTLGEVIIDDSEFWDYPKFLILDSPAQGYITSDNSQTKFYLTDDSSILNSKMILGITVKSHYFNGDYPEESMLMQSYIKENLSTQLPFSPNREVSFKWEPRDDFYFHELLNPYFV